MMIITPVLLFTLAGSNTVPADNLTGSATLNANTDTTAAAISIARPATLVSCEKYVAEEKGYTFLKDCSAFARKVIDYKESFDYLIPENRCKWWQFDTCLAGFCAPDLLPWQLDVSQVYDAVRSVQDRCIFWGVSTGEYREGVAFFDVCAGTGRPCRSANLSVTFFG